MFCHSHQTLNRPGQEDKTIEYDGSIKITPFNMEDEMEEGHFDKDGMFIFNRDKPEIRDNWLDNIDWVKVSSSFAALCVFLDHNCAVTLVQIICMSCHYQVMKKNRGTNAGPCGTPERILHMRELHMVAVTN